MCGTSRRLGCAINRPRQNHFVQTEQNWIYVHEAKGRRLHSKEFGSLRRVRLCDMRKRNDLYLQWDNVCVHGFCGDHGLSLAINDMPFNRLRFAERAVLAIILAGTLFGGYLYLSSWSKTKRTRTLVNSLEEEALLFHSDNDRMPTSNELIERWRKKGYSAAGAEKSIYDEWGKPVVINSGANFVTIISLGRDMLLGTKDDITAELRFEPPKK
jgi:hypothetical protein